MAFFSLFWSIASFLRTSMETNGLVSEFGLGGVCTILVTEWSNVDSKHTHSSKIFKGTDSFTSVFFTSCISLDFREDLDPLEVHQNNVTVQLLTITSATVNLFSHGETIYFMALLIFSLLGNLRIHCSLLSV
jgi:hypothetical protein